MSGAFPTTPVPMNLTIGTLQPSLVSRAQSLKRQTRTRGGQRWTVKAAWGPLSRANFAALWAFLVAQQGRWDTFTWVLPTYSTPRGSWATSGTIQVNGASQTGTTLNIDGFTPSASNVVLRGDFFKVAGHSKVYMITADANANGSGQVAASIMPKLVTSPADNEVLTITSVPFTLALAQDAHEFTAAAPAAGVRSFSLEMVEEY